MKTCYVDPHTRAIADLYEMDEMPGGYMEGWMICRINVPREHRGKGLGSKLLDEICADADREGVTLWLEPISTSGTVGLGQKDLESWYARRGFFRSGIMKRSPGAGINHLRDSVLV